MAEAVSAIQLRPSLNEYTKYLGETASQITSCETIDQATTVLDQLVDLFYGYPISGQLIGNCKAQKPSGIFIPILAVDICQSLQIIFSQIVVAIRG